MPPPSCARTSPRHLARSATSTHVRVTSAASSWAMVLASCCSGPEGVLNPLAREPITHARNTLALAQRQTAYTPHRRTTSGAAIRQRMCAPASSLSRAHVRETLLPDPQDTKILTWPVGSAPQSSEAERRSTQCQIAGRITAREAAAGTTR